MFKSAEDKAQHLMDVLAKAQATLVEKPKAKAKKKPTPKAKAE